MKLIREYVDFKEMSVMVEDATTTDADAGVEKKKHFKLKGVFLQSESKNRNGRIYSRDLLMREVTKYNEEKIKTSRAVGECDHPDSPQINLDRISHVIESLEMVGDDGVGVLRLIDTPMGKIAQTLVSENILLGVSTRGVGSLDGEYVKDDYQLITPADLVYDPSASKAFVESVVENKEWIIDGNKWVEVAVANLKESMDKQYSGRNLSQHALRYMLNFMNEIKNN